MESFFKPIDGITLPIENIYETVSNCFCWFLL